MAHLADAVNLLDTIALVLQKSGEPLHAREITRRLLRQGLWATNSRSPQVSVQTSLARDIRVRKMDSRFQRVGPAVFALREWSLPGSPVTGQEVRICRPAPAGGIG